MGIRGRFKGQKEYVSLTPLQAAAAKDTYGDYAEVEITLGRRRRR